ncbi:MAG: single-stranded-DNA-specific exonuclease RecJ [Caldilineaceae bacterium]|nr:single-stranded-DNA-specific exonuclease RecJ [Caldilineaceae bacterium]
MFRPKRWILQPPAPDSFLRAVPEHPLLAQVLYNRGLRSAAEVAAFLNGDDAVAENPYRLRDMVPAVQRIVQAIRANETICVYGDFDVDGVTATALLSSALQAAGGSVGPYIPDRVDEGYGLNLDAVERIARKATLMVTVDCGIRSVREVAAAMKLGMDVVVTDHHTVGSELPGAVAVINPRRADCPSSFDRLAGVGVAYRLAQAVLRVVAQESWSRLTPEQASEIEERLLDLVALGTVADMMPLLGENRRLVRRGLELINRAPRAGIEALMLQAALRPGMVDAAAISFRLAPRLNAAGRLDHAHRAYRLLRTHDATEAHTLAVELEELNRRRRQLTDEAEREAERQLAAVLADDPPIFIVSSSSFDHGIVGLVAGKLTERYYRPAVVMREEQDETRGSARSIPEFNISHALDEIDELLVRHGGHQTAAGFTVKTDRLPDFRAALAEVAHRALPDRSGLLPILTVDAAVPLSDVTWGVVEQFGRLEPTGEENPPPVLMARGVRVRSARTVGGGKHLRLVLDDGASGIVYDAVGFHLGVWHDKLGEGSRIDIAFHAEVNQWQGRARLQLNVQDLRPAES